MGAYVIALNWATIPWNRRLAARREQRHVSTVPIVGPLLMTIGGTFAVWHPSIHVLWCWPADWATCTLPFAIVTAKRR
jgi:hypothetical protein